MGGEGLGQCFSGQWPLTTLGYALTATVAGAAVSCRNVPSYPVLFRGDASFENIHDAIKGDTTMYPEWGEVTCIKDIPRASSPGSLPLPYVSGVHGECMRWLPMDCLGLFFNVLSSLLFVLLSCRTKISLRLLNLSV